MFSRTGSTGPDLHDDFDDQDHEYSGGAVKRSSLVSTRIVETKKDMTDSERKRLEEYMKLHELSGATSSSQPKQNPADDLDILDMPPDPELLERALAARVANEFYVPTYSVV
jgi:hypothetical protein